MNAIGTPSTAPVPETAAALPARESYSSVSTYESCPRRYAYRYVERLPGEIPVGWFTFGSAVHRAFEAFDRARIAIRGSASPPPGYEVLERAFTGAIKASGCEPSQMEQLAVRSRPVLRAYLEREAASDATPVGVELGFGVDVPVGENEPPIRFVGYVDRIDRRPDGTIELLDHKTGRSRSQAEVDRDDQLTAYAFACARGGLRDPSSGEPFPAPARLGLHFAESGLTVWTTAPERNSSRSASASARRSGGSDGASSGPDRERRAAGASTARPVRTRPRAGAKPERVTRAAPAGLSRTMPRSLGLRAASGR